MTAIVGLLQIIAQSRSTQMRGDAGHYRKRSELNGEKKRLLGPVEVALSSIVALFVCFAALYAALISVNGSGIAAAPCHINWIDMIYFSASVGATVGFGDISPTSNLMRLVTTSEIIVFFAVLALFLQALWINPKPRVD